MSLRRSLVATYVSQIYVALIGIAMVPMYVKYMGTEAYGLVGFFAMLQAWFQLLDMGLTPTLARQAARYLGGATTALELRQLLRVLERVFVATALLGSACLAAAAPAIASAWLRVEHLPLGEVRNALVLMAICIALRWIGTLYRSMVNGLEQQIWLGWFSMATATARFVLVIPFFLLVGAEPVHFFSYQVVVALLEATVIAAKAYRLLPPLAAGIRVRAEWRALGGVLRFALSIAFTSSLWVFVTQTDKLLLSRLLSLSDYAYFTLAVLVASGVSVLSGPISGVLLPRLSRLHAAGDSHGLLALYRQATQGMSVIAFTVSIALACFAQPLLWAWTGNASLAERAGPMLALYALGNGVLAVSAFPYYLQYAHGDVRLHLRGSVFFVIALIPAVLYAASRWGAVGAGWAWLGANLAYLLCWVPLVHRRFIPGLHLRWLGHDIAGPALLVGAVGLLAGQMPLPTQRWSAVVAVAGFILAMLAVGAMGSTMGRRAVGRIVNWK